MFNARHNKTLSLLERVSASVYVKVRERNLRGKAWNPPGDRWLLYVNATYVQHPVMNAFALPLGTVQR